MVKLTCLMTTYNESVDIVSKSIASVLSQTFTDFILLIVIDNPNNTELIDYIKEIKDNRVEYIVNEKNLGLANSLNVGIESINTKYIARMDADDIAHKDRFAKQVDYMDDNPSIGLLGSNITYMENSGRLLRDRGNIPTKCDVLANVLKFVNVMNHPTFFGRTEVFKKYKYRNLRFAQDYEFVCRLLENGVNVENLQESLLDYRLCESVSKEKRVKQKITFCCVQSLFRKKKLTESDIHNIVDNRMKKIDVNKVSIELEKYNEFIEHLRSKNLIKIIVYIFHNIFFETYLSKKNLFNLLAYFIIKKIYAF